MDDMFFNDDIINMDSLEKAEYIFFTTLEAIRNKDRASRQERFSLYRDKCTNDITGPQFDSGVWYVLYFDSNGGCALFSSPEPEYKGAVNEDVKFELIECTSCDIPFSTMQYIMDKLQEYSNL